MTKNSPLILVSLIFGMFSILFVWFGDPNVISTLSKEDGVIETLSAMFYMIGILFGFVAIFKADRVFLPIIWTILCVLFLGEETSWFQRFFDYSVPEVEQLNAQNEFNFHNLHLFQGGGLLSSPFSLDNFLKSQNIFRIGFFGYFLVLPFICVIPKFNGWMLKLGYKKPDGQFILVLAMIFLLSFLLAFFVSVDLNVALAETREMLYAFFIMLYLFIYVLPRATVNSILNQQ